MNIVDKFIRCLETVDKEVSERLEKYAKEFFGENYEIGKEFVRGGVVWYAVYIDSIQKLDSSKLDSIRRLLKLLDIEFDFEKLREVVKQLKIFITNTEPVNYLLNGDAYSILYDKISIIIEEEIEESNILPKTLIYRKEITLYYKENQYYIGLQITLEEHKEIRKK